MKSLLMKPPAGLILPLLLLAAGRLSPQNLSLGGSLEGTLSYHRYAGDSPLVPEGAGEYRLDSYLVFNPQVRLGEPGGAQGYLDVDVVAAEILDSATNRPNQAVTAVLNQAYLSAPLSQRLFFNLGKKRIVWGVALAYNPSDFINPAKDPLHPEEERRGVYCAELELIADRMSVNQVVVFYDRLEAFGYGAKLSAYGLVPATDVNLSFYYSAYERFNLGASLDSAPFGELPVLGGLALHAEAGFSQRSDAVTVEGASLARRPPRRAFYRDFLAGLRYTAPDWGTRLAAEYYTIGDGYTRRELAELIGTGLIADVPLEPGAMGRHNLLVSVFQPELTRRASAFTDTLSVSASLLLNLLDSSFVVTAGLSSSIVQNCELGLEAGFFAGDRVSEYGVLPERFHIDFQARIGF